MIYISLNVGDLLDPIEEQIYKKYLSTTVVNFNKATIKSYITSEPFFSDKWLVLINYKDFKVKEVYTQLMGTVFADILISIDKADDYVKCQELLSHEISEIRSSIASGKKYNAFTKERHSQKEIEDYLESQLKVKCYSAYEVPVEYIQAYILNRVLHIDTSDKTKSIKLHPIVRSRVFAIAQRARGNERQLKTVLDLYGYDLLTTKEFEKLNTYLPEPVYLTVNNFHTYIFSRETKKKTAIFNLLYNYEKSPVTLFNSLIKFFDTYQKVYFDYVSGQLSVRTKLQWYEKNGKLLKINSETKLERWWYIVQNNSFERMLSYRLALIKAKESGNRTVLFHTIVKLAMMYLG